MPHHTSGQHAQEQQLMLMVQQALCCILTLDAAPQAVVQCMRARLAQDNGELVQCMRARLAQGSRLW